jgi:serine/threonine protein kinase
VLDKRHIQKEKKTKYVAIERDTLNLLDHHPGCIRLYSTFQDECSLCQSSFFFCYMSFVIISLPVSSDLSISYISLRKIFTPIRTHSNPLAGFRELSHHAKFIPSFSSDYLLEFAPKGEILRSIKTVRLHPLSLSLSYHPPSHTKKKKKHHGRKNCI